jgi:hypothetical protein
MLRLLFAIVTLTATLAAPQSALVSSQVSQVPAFDELRLAVVDHDAVRLARLLERGRPEAFSMGALVQIAIERDDVAAVRLLLTHGADPNFGLNGVPETPLITAARVGCWEIIDVLLQAGADPNGRAGLGNKVWFPLYYAVLNRHYRATTLLLSAKANANARLGVDSGGRGRYLKPGEGQTPLMVAAGQCDAQMVESLLNHGADPTLTDENGRRAIDWLRECQDPVERIKTLLTQPPKR